MAITKHHLTRGKKFKCGNRYFQYVLTGAGLTSWQLLVIQIDTDRTRHYVTPVYSISDDGFSVEIITNKRYLKHEQFLFSRCRPYNMFTECLYVIKQAAIKSLFYQLGLNFLKANSWNK